jgi:transcriptional regulator of acetoin/glycerol metabolism
LPVPIESPQPRCCPHCGGIRLVSRELPPVPLGDLQPPATQAPAPASAVSLADAEREHILRALRETGGVLGGPEGAAARLGMKRSTLYKKMKKLGISRFN